MVVDTKPPHNIIRKLSTKISAQTPLSADCLVLTPNQQVSGLDMHLDVLMFVV